LEGERISTIERHAVPSGRDFYARKTRGKKILVLKMHFVLKREMNASGVSLHPERELPTSGGDPAIRDDGQAISTREELGKVPPLFI
jgi:hypothetical protein